MPDKPQKKSVVVPETQKIKFEKSDFDVIITLLDNYPELKICALALKGARAAKLKYPVKTKESIKALLVDNKRLNIEGHRINDAEIDKYFIEQDFPIANERQFLARVHMALWRCNEDVLWSLRAPKDSASIIKSITQKS